MNDKKEPEAAPESEVTGAWTPPDVCPECGDPGIIPVYERQSVACPQCRKEIPCE